MDAVYNHFGPSGNYTGAFSPHYLSDRHKNPWGDCVNLDGTGSAMVREFFIENAMHWVHEYHVDGLRLDATHALIDDSPRHFLAELADRVRATVPDRRVLIHAEDHRNLHTMIRPGWAGGWDLDGVWADDFHHQVRRHLAGDNEGYYRDYTGSIGHIAETLNQGWFYCGQHSVHLDEPRGTDPVGIEPHKFVTCLQNHDQVGNRAFGERLHHQIDHAAYRAATALWLCAPQTPLLFMGQEWAASAPFLFFTDHEEDLGVLITEGRRREFRHFLAFVDPDVRERIPDPQARSTFEASRLDWSERDREPYASILRLYQALLDLRRTEPALRPGGYAPYEAVALDEGALALRRNAASGASLLATVRIGGAGAVDLHTWPGARPGAGRRWEPILTTEDAPFAPDPRPIHLDLNGPTPMIDFARPSAVFFRAVST
jgi:maltooligosyltrehalose trehalohydrolase